MEIDILSLFPEYFGSPLDASIVKRAQENGLVSIRQTDIRDFAEGKHRQVDDRPYGGGPGMVMMPGPVQRAIQSVRQPHSRVVYLSPQGQTLTAAKCRELATHEHLVLLCGHYEGIDQRVLDEEVDEEISIGDYVLTNGCLPALVLVDAVLRMVPGVLGHEEAAQEESFESGLLDWPHYTRPESFEGTKVPQELLGGDHKEIHRWRLRHALKKTQEMRPDLYARYLVREGWEGTARKPPRERPSFMAEQGLDSVRLMVHSLKRSLEFYKGQLGLHVLEKSAAHAVLDLGNTRLYLIEGQHERVDGLRPVFEVVVQDDALFDRVARRALERGDISYEAHKVLKPMRETVTIEFCDPDGYYWCVRYRGLIQQEIRSD